MERRTRKAKKTIEDVTYVNDKINPEVIQSKYLIYSFFAIIFMIIYSYYTLYESVSKPEFTDSKVLGQPHTNIKYAVIIDAGSTGSRVLAFRFKEDESGNLSLDKQYFKQVTPGLSSFKDPQQGAESIIPLLEGAKTFVEEEYWRKTPIELKATAGLRLLNEDKANEIIKSVQLLIDSCEFDKTSNSVSIMNGKDEGRFSWFTLNFLKGKLYNMTDTVAAIDLGGGSIQISYISHDVHEQEFITEFKLLNNNVRLYCQSYLGLGLMSARKDVLNLSKQINVYDNKHFINSPCVPETAIDLPFTFDEIDYLVSGKGNTHNYEQCKKIVEQFFDGITYKKPKDLDNQEIVAFSYIYDIALKAKLVGDEDLTINSFYKAAKSECINKTPQKFECLDLIYVSVLLEKVLGLPLDKKFKVLKTINDNEISWALGAAFSIIETST